MNNCLETKKVVDFGVFMPLPSFFAERCKKDMQGRTSAFITNYSQQS